MADMTEETGSVENEANSVLGDVQLVVEELTARGASTGHQTGGPTKV